MTHPDEPLSHFTELDILRCVQLETEAAFVRYKAVDVPRAILLAGQPGAGKTVLSDTFVSALEDNVAFVNGDDYRRQHPHYRELYGKYGSDFVDMVSPFSNQVSNKPSVSLAGSRFQHEALEPVCGGNPNYTHRLSFRSPLRIPAQFGIRQIEMKY